MGMFDSFFITNLQNEEVEIQTKQLECILDHYRIGDTVPSLNKYHGYKSDNFFLIEDYYLDDIFNAKNQRYVGIIIVHNIYIDYLAGDFTKSNILDLEKTCQKYIDGYINNPQTLVAKFERIIKEKLLKKISEQANQLNEIRSVLFTYKDFKEMQENPNMNTNILKPITERARLKQFEAGLDPIAIIENILTNKDDIKLFE